MTEHDWLRSTEYEPMLRHVDMKNPRKQRLFACAACRYARNHLRATLEGSLYRVREPETLQAIEEIEKMLDGLSTASKVERILDRVPELIRYGPRNPRSDPSMHLHTAVHNSFQRNVSQAAHLASHSSIEAIAWQYPLTSGALGLTQAARFVRRQRADAEAKARRAANQALADILRDIFGNPFAPVALEPDWLRWRNGTISAMAEEVYNDRSYEQLPILGDALEDAGCSEPSVLEHCRSGGEHVRGCWVLDLLLEKDRPKSKKKKRSREI